jgi:hypothetical protein
VKAIKREKPKDPTLVKLERWAPDSSRSLKGWATRPHKSTSRKYRLCVVESAQRVLIPSRGIERIAPMTDTFAVTISTLSLCVSALIAWLTLLRRGTVKMTQPTVIYFGPDSPRTRDEPALPKVFLRTLLFATSKRGRVVESMHVALARSETQQNFNIWVYGDDRLVRGSGLFVGETGVAANHHFLAPKDGSSFRFTEGRYRIDVYAKLLGDRKKKLLFSQTVEVSLEVAAQLKGSYSGLYFDWGPDSSRYLPHIDRRPPPPNEDFLELLDLTRRSKSRSGA